LVDWPGSAMLANGNEGMAGQIRRTPGAIGYVEFGTASRAGLSMAALENRTGLSHTLLF
jgi:phosphate transport system substrate-binding protein